MMASHFLGADPSLLSRFLNCRAAFFLLLCLEYNGSISEFALGAGQANDKGQHDTRKSVTLRERCVFIPLLIFSLNVFGTVFISLRPLLTPARRRGCCRGFAPLRFLSSGLGVGSSEIVFFLPSAKATMGSPLKWDSPLNQRAYWSLPRSCASTASSSAWTGAACGACWMLRGHRRRSGRRACGTSYGKVWQNPHEKTP